MAATTDHPAIKHEWHPTLGPPFFKDYKGEQTMHRYDGNACCGMGWCCCCCGDQEKGGNSIMFDLRSDEQLNMPKKSYSEFFGIPVAAGESHRTEFSGLKPNARPASPVVPRVQQQQQHHHHHHHQQFQQQHHHHQAQHPGVMMMGHHHQHSSLQQQQQPQQQQQQQVVAPTPTAPGASAAAVAAPSGVAAVASPLTTQSQQPQRPLQEHHQQQQQQPTEPAKPAAGAAATPSPSPSAPATGTPTAVAAGSPQQNPQQQQQQQVLAFGRYIGIDPDKEPYLLGYAHQCLAMPPPAPWQAARDPQSGRTYYGNAETKQTSWDHPLIGQFRTQVQELRKQYVASQQQRQQHQQQHQQQPSSSSAEPGEETPLKINPLSGDNLSKDDTVTTTEDDTPVVSPAQRVDDENMPHRHATPPK